ncbi:MAG: hypothetical protein ACRYFS_22650 [Janthinobacterium lividum]
MKTPVIQRETLEEQPAYFLAGHPDPAGIYHEIETNRELQMEEMGVLPATCDGHVAVYIRRPLTWAEIAVNSAMAVSRDGTA